MRRWLMDIKMWSVYKKLQLANHPLTVRLSNRLNLCSYGWKCPHCGLAAKASKRGLVDFLEPWHRDRCWQRPENVGKRWSEFLPKL